MQDKARGSSCPYFCLCFTLVLLLVDISSFFCFAFVTFTPIHLIKALPTLLVLQLGNADLSRVPKTGVLFPAGHPDSYMTEAILVGSEIARDQRRVVQQLYR